jgi:hypothetical protein
LYQLPAVAVFISLLQLLYAALGDRATKATQVQFALAALTFALALVHRGKLPRLVGLAGLITLAAILNVALIFQRGGPPAGAPLLRLLLVASLFSYLGLALSALLTVELQPSRAMLVGFLLAASLFTAELTLDPPKSSALVVPAPIVSGSMVLDVNGGRVHKPNSLASSSFVRTKAGTLREQDLRSVQWGLRMGGKGAAQIKFPADQPDAIRVQVASAPADNKSYVYLDKLHFNIHGQSRYRLSFRARADQPRKITIGANEATGAWRAIGPWYPISLTTKWQEFQQEFRAPFDAEDASILFEIVNDPTPIEISNVVLQDFPSGDLVEPKNPLGSVAVRYRFNSLGCRDREYPMEKQPGSTRILMLGDSYTLGVAANSANTMPARLEALGNETSDKAGPKLEVINCGAAGYGVKDDRRFYESIGAQYDPDLVVATVTWRDATSYWSDAERSNAERQPGKWEKLLYTWGAVQSLRYRIPTPEYSRTVAELQKLKAACDKAGARLVVFVYRNDADFGGSAEGGRIWNSLTQTVTSGLAGNGVPVLDLGAALAATHPEDALAIHARLAEEPDETTHAIAARELLAFLQAQKLIRPSAASSPQPIPVPARRSPAAVK